MAGGRLARLLLVDNSAEYIDPIRDRLIDEGWRTDVARTPEEALEKVRQHRYQICILDKRLRDDRSESDKSGLELIPDLWREDGLLHFVLLTGYPDFLEATEQMRGRFTTRQRHSDGYVPKEYGVDKLVEELERVERDVLTINWNLAISSQLDMAATLEPLLRETDDALRRERLQKLTEDTELLLRWIFYSNKKFPNLRFELLDAQGRSGARVLRASADGNVEWVVKLATRLAVEEEWDNYNEHVQQAIAQHPQVGDMCQVGSHLGAIVYRSVTEIQPGARLRNLGEYLLDPQTAEADADKALQAVVYNARAWFSRERSGALRDLTAYYQAHFHLDSTELADRFRRLDLDIPDVGTDRVLGGERIGGEVMNPLPFLARSRFLVESDWNICHGDLNASNILMPAGVPWFIDFASTGPGPTALDWVTLEASLKLDHPREGTPEQWFRLEESLALQESLEEPPAPPPGLSPDLQRLFSAVATLRRVVARQAQLRTGLLEYFVGLFYATVHQVRFYWRKERNRKAYRLLASAGLLAERLAGLGVSRSDIALVFSFRSIGPALSGAGQEPTSDADPREALRITQEKLLHEILNEMLGRQPKASGKSEGQLASRLEELTQIKESLKHLKGAPQEVP